MQQTIELNVFVHKQHSTLSRPSNIFAQPLFRRTVASLSNNTNVVESDESMTRILTLYLTKYYTNKLKVNS